MTPNFIFYTFCIIFHLKFTQPIVAGGVRGVKSASSDIGGGAFYTPGATSHTTLVEILMINFSISVL